jgi:hypothetical protein
MTERTSADSLQFFLNEPEHAGKIEDIKARCKKANISVNFGIIFDDVQGYELKFSRDGFHTRTHWLVFPKSLNAIEQICFENVAFLRHLDGIYDVKSKTVEVTLTGSTRLSLAATYLLFAEGQKEVVIDPPRANLPKIRIGTATDRHAVLCHGPEWGEITLTITDIEGSNAEEIENKVLAYAVPILLEIESRRGISLRIRRLLKKSLRTYRIEREKQAKLKQEKLVLTYPSQSYEHIPATLFLLAQGFKYLPSLRFLFLYQALEYFFIRVNREEAFKVIGSLINDSSFDSSDENHITRLLSAIQPKWINPAKGEEEQLKTLIKKHIPPSDLLKFINSDQDLKEHLALPNNTTEVIVPTECEFKALIAMCAKRIIQLEMRLFMQRKMIQDQGILFFLKQIMSRS